ncbi:coiled-coil domain-containing protein 86-like [Xenia sp. Carnegie-2017]|uniref:coiled-coil domain-containing protein 86-like n=1 Tax=Xenia sp. Carnegie-2017 TaxID=2897299 RepID=UPI001F04C962|nr:coiled-coil domain-containing protein 86-like [Xenia sp. Carnegie-2017]
MASKKSPRGKPKSGRFWKCEGTKKSNMINVPSLHSTWMRKVNKKLEEKNVKNLENKLKEAAKLQREARKKLLEERRQRRQENEKKSQVVQVITNSSKLKRMKKKQLRQVEKR